MVLYWSGMIGKVHLSQSQKSNPLYHLVIFKRFLCHADRQTPWKSMRETERVFTCMPSLYSSISMWFWGQGNSTVVSVSVYQVGDPGSRSPRSTCHRKVEFYHCVIDSFPPVPTTGLKKAVHVLLCLCNHACKRSLAFCRKSRALCPVSRLLSVHIWPAWWNRDFNMIQ